MKEWEEGGAVGSERGGFERHFKGSPYVRLPTDDDYQ